MQEVLSAQIFKTSSAFLEYRRFEARRAVFCPPSAYKEPKLGQKRRLQVDHFTPCIADAKYRLRNHGWVQKGKFRYFGLKSRGIFTPSLSFLPSFFFINVPLFCPVNFLGLISLGNVLEKSRLVGLEGRKYNE